MTVRAFYNASHDEPVLIRTPEQMDTAIDGLMGQPFSDSIAAMYSIARPTNKAGLPDHEFYIAVNPRDGVGGVMYSGEHDGDDGTWFSVGNVSQYDEVCYYYMGNDREFPRDSEISIDLVRQAAREFLANGGNRPECIEWQPWQPKNGPDANQ